MAFYEFRQSDCWVHILVFLLQMNYIPEERVSIKSAFLEPQLTTRYIELEARQTGKLFFTAI